MLEGKSRRRVDSRDRQVRLTCLSAALISLLLMSAFSAVLISSSKAPTSITLWMVTVTEPSFGYHGGYHEIVAKLQTEFAKIGITLKWVTYDAADWDSIIFDDTWNRTGDYNSNGWYDLGIDGWDLTIFEQRLNPSSYIWLDAMAYSWSTPPTGWNIMSWNDTTADALYKKAQTTTTVAKHTQYMHLWQEEFMHNPPAIPIYYAYQYTALPEYLDGYDDVAWLYDLSQLDINETKFNEVAPPWRKAIGSDTVIWAAAEDIWTVWPLGTLTRTEEAVNVLKQGMLYRMSREDMTFPTSGRYINLPTLAADNPTWYQKPDGRWTARVPLVQGLTWTDGVEFNASDVAFTWECVLDPAMKSQSYADFRDLIDEVNVVDRYTVDFVYQPGMGPDYDFAGYQATGWGLGMLPKHQFEGPIPWNWMGQIYSHDPIPDSADGIIGEGTTRGLEALGPYVPVSYNGTLGAITSIKFQKRPNFVNTLGWSSTMPEYFILKIIGDPWQRFAALQNLEVDFIEYPTAPVGDWTEMIGCSTHRVYTYLYPASHPLWIQQRNPVLSNRYVRLALAHAIPYQSIFSEILPLWGVATAIQGRTFILPSHDVYDTTLGTYEYDITKAQMYMDMYQNSIDPANWANGPLGDHDFDGLVEIPDYPIWVNNLGKSVDSLPWWPSNHIDPDNDNDGYVELNDIWYWAQNIGKEYPYPNPW